MRLSDHLALNLSRVFSLRSRESGMVCLSRGFAVSPSRPRTGLSRLLADGRVSNLVSIRFPLSCRSALGDLLPVRQRQPRLLVLAHWQPS
jgi:hypothetical protein